MTILTASPAALRPRSAGRPVHRRAALALAALLLAGAPPARALDTTWLGQVDNLWFSNPTVVNGVARYNWAPGAPINSADTAIIIDGLAGRGNRVQVASISPLSASPGCSGSFICASVGPRMGRLTLGAGTLLAVGGSDAFGDGPQYANGGARLEWMGANGGAAEVLNEGTLRLSSLGRNAMVGIFGTVQLSGSGQTVLDNGYAEGTALAAHNARQFFYGGNGGYGDVLVVNAGHTLRGRGSLGTANGYLAIDNHGLIQAESGGQLLLTGLLGIAPPRTHSIVNTGTLQAVGGARLTLQGTVDNHGGQLLAQAGSVVELGASVSGGALATADDGLIRVTGTVSNRVTLADARLAGELQVGNGKWLGLGPGLVNDGLLRIGGLVPGSSSSQGAELHVMEDVRIAGSGRIVMGDASMPTPRFTGYSGLIGRTPVLTFGAGQSLSGAAAFGGSSGAGTLAFVNEGTIQVNGTAPLIVNAAVLPGRSDSIGFLNRGLLQVQGGAMLQSLASSLGNGSDGRLIVEAGGTLSGGLVQVDGHVSIDGQAGSIQLRGGLLDGSGSIGSLTQTGGVFAPGHSPGRLAIEGNYTLNGGDLVLEVDGSGADQADHLHIGGALNLFNGRIVVDLSDYQGQGALSFADLLQVDGLLRSAHPVLGTAASLVISGLAPGRQASLAWNGGQLGLSVAAAPVPEPAAWALWAGGLLLLGRRLARRRG
ncbi:MAG: hypothetical protein KBC73_03085 [Burkholderiaceae bacterium]|nr:hypothetical protein [Burkholderiaceae bacterium]